LYSFVYSEINGISDFENLLLTMIQEIAAAEKAENAAEAKETLQ
jgi:hypothetical protein